MKKLSCTRCKAAGGIHERFLPFRLSYCILGYETKMIFDKNGEYVRMVSLEDCPRPLTNLQFVNANYKKEDSK